MAPVQSLWLPAPTGGEAPSLPPDQLKNNVARELRNWLVHHPGRVVPRGEFGGPRYAVPGGTMPSADGGQVLSAAVAENLLSVSFRAPSAAPLVDPWRAPVNQPQTAAELALGSDDGGALDIKTGAWTPIGLVAADSIQGPSVARLNRNLYTATFGGTATAVPGGYATLNAVRKIQFGGSGAVMTTGPRFVQAVFEHYGRLWAAAARRPGGTDYDLSQVFYTIPGGTTEPLVNTATDWQDPVTGEINRFAVGAANDGDFVVGFGRAAGHLLVFKRYSVWILYGTSPSNFTLRQLRNVAGCVDLRSVVVAPEGTYFASQLGYELFDGNRFTLLSGPVADTWLDLSNAGVAADTVNHAFIQAQALPNGYLHVALGTDSHVAGAADGTQRAWLLHRPTGAWIDLRTRLAMGLGARGHVQRFIPFGSASVAISGTGAWVRADRVTYGHDQLNGLADNITVDVDVDLVWRTGLQNIGGHWGTVQLHALSLSGAWAYVSSAVDPPGWATLEGTDGSGAVIVPTHSVEGFPAPGPERCRPMYEKKHESPRGDLALRLTAASGAAAATQLAKCELYGVGIGFTPARERHLA